MAVLCRSVGFELTTDLCRSVGFELTTDICRSVGFELTTDICRSVGFELTIDLRMIHFVQEMLIKFMAGRSNEPRKLIRLISDDNPRVFAEAPTIIKDPVELPL